MGKQGTIIIKTPASGSWTTSWNTGYWYFENGSPHHYQVIMKCMMYLIIMFLMQITRLML